MHGQDKVGGNSAGQRSVAEVEAGQSVREDAAPGNGVKDTLASGTRTTDAQRLVVDEKRRQRDVAADDEVRCPLHLSILDQRQRSQRWRKAARRGQCCRLQGEGGEGGEVG